MFLSEGWIRLSRGSELCSAGQKTRAQNKENICSLEPALGLLMGGERLLISMVVGRHLQPNNVPRDTQRRASASEA